MRRLLRMMAVLALAGVAMPAAARQGGGGLTAFKDWSAVCDNTRQCAAFGWRTGDLAFTAWLKLSRGAEGRDLPVIRIAMMPEDGDKAGPGLWVLAVDGKPVAGLAPQRVVEDGDYRRVDLSGPAALALLGAMRNGAMLTAVENGRPVLGISLAGATAAMLWIDERQQRLGTVTALVRKGATPAAAVPAPPPLPIIAPAPPVSQAGLPKRLPKTVEGLLGEDCYRDPSSADFPAVIARLAPGKVLFGAVCNTAAYNIEYAFFIGGEQGQAARPVLFPDPPGSNPAAYDSLLNARYDPGTRILTSFSKGRGVGDCGSDSAWVWDGRAFRLLSQKVMSECFGVTAENWPDLWRARVK